MDSKEIWQNILKKHHIKGSSLKLLIEQWNFYEEYADSHFLVECNQDSKKFNERLGEMALACYLNENGLTLQRGSNSRKSAQTQARRDFLIKCNKKNLWIEATTINDSQKPDPKVARSNTFDWTSRKIIKEEFGYRWEKKDDLDPCARAEEIFNNYRLRLTHSFKAKRDQVDEDDIIESFDYVIIAINSGNRPFFGSLFDDNDIENPFFMAMLGPVILDGSPWGRTHNIKKIGLETNIYIENGLLLKEDSKIISGVLEYDLRQSTASDEWYLNFIHNPNALNKLPPGWLRKNNMREFEVVVEKSIKTHSFLQKIKTYPE